jgi:fructosamine-3-kinase
VDHTKRRPGAPAGFFAVEAAGLRWLAVPGGASVVPVVSVTPTSITVARVATTRPTPEAARRFGGRLVVTHDAGAPAFGCPPAGWSADGFIGDAPLTLRPTGSWGEFYAEQRVLAFAIRAHRLGSLSTSGLAVIAALAERIGSGEFDDSAPVARIHGDLWSGNVLWSGDSATMLVHAVEFGGGYGDQAVSAARLY